MDKRVSETRDDVTDSEYSQKISIGADGGGIGGCNDEEKEAIGE